MKLPAVNIVFRDALNDSSEMSFKVYKAICEENWDKITDFKLVWAKEWNKWFEIAVELSDSEAIVKNITATSLGDAELSQINLYEKEINTEDDIDRDDYKPTVFYNPDDKNTSLLDRLLEKAPHYGVGHVDDSLKSIQRSFSFDGTTIHDALKDVAEEVECIIIPECTSDADGKIVREINAYDLKQYCLDCGTRGDFTTSCSNCGGTNIKSGYGTNTTIFVSSENLADDITYSTDNDSVKNCFKLEAGDDLMTAAVVSCNPNGSAYLWHISDESKEDMSTGLAEKLAAYDADYNYYYGEYTVTVPNDLLTKYNALIDKYSVYSTDYSKATQSIIGYSQIMERYFDTIDFGIFLKSGLMPSPAVADTTAAKQLVIIQEQLKSPVSVKSMDTYSTATAESAVLGMAKAVADNRYQIRISNSAGMTGMWTGVITVTNASDESDTATSGTLSCTINDDYENYVKQKILKSMKKVTDNAVSVDAMFKLSDTEFAAELPKYGLSSLTSFHNIAQSCIDILIEHGISDDTKWLGTDDDLYTNLYLPYYNKLGLLEAEMQLREQEIAIIVGLYDTDGNLMQDGMQSFLESKRDFVQSKLNFNDYLGEEYVLELAAYRRDDTYSNSNYISDGLNNADLFKMAQQFIKTAQLEIEKSSTLQHSISAGLHNLLAMKEFSRIVNYFEIGNWIRVRADDKIYKLRLTEYEIDFDNFDSIDVSFSDVVVAGGTINDVESILSQASSMATSYDYVAHQAKQGEKSNDQLSDWVNRGLSLTNMKIVDSADNQNISWDSHGLLCREYLPITNSYDDKQLKLISRGLYLTDDNWKTSKAGIGDFTFWNPKTEKMEEAYGVIANVIVGNIILSEEVGIYNQNNSIVLDQNGLTITANGDETSADTKFLIQKKTIDKDGNINYAQALYIDADGNLVLGGSTKVSSTDAEARSVNDLASVNSVTEMVKTSREFVISAVDEAYSSKDDLSKLQESMRSELSVLSGQVQISISQATEQINNSNESLQNQINEIKANYKFTADGQYIGKSDSDTTLRLMNDTIQILVSGSAVVEIDKQGLNAAEVNATVLHLGDYSLTVEKNGHLTLS